ncbi:hypothetical protein LH29_10825 [Draconibacterium sediminis]|uniref:Uncharacterized protein n=1 Tax=Draconibacterium sediminis TaxID=1544798 RepID=A0A0D8JAQ3_9BACT|nr:hypothetical protein LH29_10825 [Draconibacterium sediminis]
MRNNILKIFTLEMLCCFTIAVLELDFGGNVEQTWHDEYDSYTTNTKVIGQDCNFIPFFSFSDFNSTTGNILYLPIIYVSNDIDKSSRNCFKKSKIFIKHEAFLI